MRHIINILFITYTILLVWGCNDSGKNSSAQGSQDEANAIHDRIIVTKAQFDQNEMTLGGISQQAFPTVIQTTGMIDVPPQNRAVISAYAGGYVKDTPLLIGDEVKKGQPLVTIENPDFVAMQQEYLEVAQRLSFLKSEFERQKTLIAEKITSQKNYLKAESEYKRALAMYNGLKKKLMMLNINPTSVENGNIVSSVTLFAPISGSVTKVNVNKGVYISPADVILEIVNTDHIHLELSVFEKDVMNIKKGQPIIFRIPEASTETFDAEVHLVGTLVDDQNRTVKVHGHLPEGFKHNFAVGMFIEARIIVDKEEKKALPEQTVIVSDGKFYVLLLETDNQDHYVFIKKEVMIGNTFNEFTSLTNPDQFKETDRFLVKGAFYLINEE